MLYLTGSLPARLDLFRALEDSEHVGVLLTPRNHYPTKPISEWRRAADNGCYSSDWDADEWRSWIRRIDPDSFIFATVPDVVGDWRGTRDRFDVYAAELDGFRRAYVLQDGQPDDRIPWADIDAVFIGGSTEYKLSPAARRLVLSAQERGKWVHMGRVNSWGRLCIAAEWGCDSVDGNFLAFGPDVNVPRLLSWLRRLDNQSQQQRLAV